MLDEIVNIKLYPFLLFDDNKSCIKLAPTWETKMSKYIKHQFAKDNLIQGKILLKCISTEN